MLDQTAPEDSELENLRLSHIIRLLPKDRTEVLEIGARDGKITRILAQRYPAVTALDLTKPSFEISGVTTVEGNATSLQFADNSFDLVVCTEVLEHIPNIERACGELARVTRGDILIGVPFNQDLRYERLTCSSCGKINPAWGHVNSFSKKRLFGLFPSMEVKTVEFCGEKKERTNWLSAALLDLGRNPWGTYHQQEPCIFCDSKMLAPTSRTLFEQICAKIGETIFRLQTIVTPNRPIWMHVIFQKKNDKAN